jgi:3-hydroxybutyryl-CoA dehydrogenase
LIKIFLEFPSKEEFMEIKRVAVLGAGIMGNGIAQVTAAAGYPVCLRDIEDPFIQKGMANIEKSLGRMVKAGKLNPGEVPKILGRVKTTTDLKKAVQDADLVVEAAPENLELKKQIFRDLDTFCPPQTILGTNTSNFSITALGAVTKRPQKVIGLHYFNPPPMMKLIEVVRGVETSEETLQTALEFAQKSGKETVLCRDSQGFITSRIINLWLTEAERIVEEGIATKEDIDKACRLAFNHPMGPFELSDFSGLDTKLAVADALMQSFGDRFRSTQTLRNLVSAGHMGRKSGKGWFNYSK